MAYKYKLIYPDGEEEISEETFETEQAAEDEALEMCSCFTAGGDVLELAGEDYIEGDCDFEIFEI